MNSNPFNIFLQIDIVIRIIFEFIIDLYEYRILALNFESLKIEQEISEIDRISIRSIFSIDIIFHENSIIMILWFNTY